MQTPFPSPSFLKKRKFLITLPLIVLPFLVILFFLLGGGGTSHMTGIEPSKQLGLNLQLPEAHFKSKKERGKLDLYDAVNQDSAKWREEIKNDPYRMGETGPLDTLSFSHSQVLSGILDKESSMFSAKDPDGYHPAVGRSASVSRENEITDKLNRLRAIVETKPVSPIEVPEHSKTFPVHPSIPNSSNFFKDGKGNALPDPELSELNRMLDKVLAIQHPQTGRDSTHQSVDSKPLGYRIENSTGENAILAIVPEKQALVSGSTIRLQLMEPVTIAGRQLPADEWIYGTVILSNERLRIQVRSIRAGKNILPVNLEIYDLDGMEGIYVPGSINRDVSKQSLDQSLSGLALETLDPSIGAQAATAGIQAAKALISRKVRLIQVTIPNDYQVLLKNVQE